MDFSEQIKKYSLFFLAPSAALLLTCGLVTTTFSHVCAVKGLTGGKGWTAYGQSSALHGAGGGDPSSAKAACERRYRLSLPVITTSSHCALEWDSGDALVQDSGTPEPLEK